MAGFFVAISGGIGAGKTALANKLVDALDADRVSFGEEVRKEARANGLNPADRSVLQQLGQALVLTDCDGFVRRVLDQRTKPSHDHLIIDGVRHIEVFMSLKERVRPKRLYLVHIETPPSLREQNVMVRDGVERRLAARYDNDITEAQVSRVLPQYASLIVKGDLPVMLQVSQVLIKAKEWSTIGDEQPVAA